MRRSAGLTNTSARTTVFVSNAGAPPPTAGKSLWPASAQPGAYSARDTQPIEVGVKFRSDVAGTVTAIRFYRNAINSGGYTVHLWSSTGALLGSGRGTDGPDTPGWTEIKLSTPVSIAANTVYVASYFSRTGQASSDENFFASSGVDNSPLHAPASSTVGGNGVFSYCSNGCFPSQLDHATNYWVTPVFVQP